MQLNFWKKLAVFICIQIFFGAKSSLGTYFHRLLKIFLEVIDYVGFAPNKVPIFISFHWLFGGPPSLPLWGDVVYEWSLTLMLKDIIEGRLQRFFDLLFIATVTKVCKVDLVRLFRSEVSDSSLFLYLESIAFRIFIF